jgi:uncharacterized peroxidase-related enzyme
VDDSLIAELAKDYEHAAIAEPDRIMLRYVDKLTRTPGAVRADDVETLREAGFSDEAILNICQVAAYYAYVNRLVDGLGVELEEAASA